jgi:dTDP-glucose 4,6-dehydratase
MRSTRARSSANSAGGPAETFDTGIRKTVQWYLDHADWVATVQSGGYRDWVATNYAQR